MLTNLNSLSSLKTSIQVHIPTWIVVWINITIFDLNDVEGQYTTRRNWQGDVARIIHAKY